MDTFYLGGSESIPEAARVLPAVLVQPFVPGLPMSASFLVGPGGRAWLIGIGTQRMAIREGRFHYQGGKIPTSCSGALPHIWAAVRAIDGLRGFVGVDFIWDSSRRRATILEINPRPTTSCVGLCRLLPRGHLARAWLDACVRSGSDDELLDGLSELVHDQSPITFDSNGTIIDHRVGVAV